MGSLNTWTTNIKVVQGSSGVTGDRGINACRDRLHAHRAGQRPWNTEFRQNPEQHLFRMHLLQAFRLTGFRCVNKALQGAS